TSSAPDTVSAVGDPSADTVSPVTQDMDAPLADTSVMDGEAVVPSDDRASPVPGQVVPAIPLDAPVPDSSELTTPAPSSSLDGTETGESAAGSPLGDTGAQSQHSGQYYDSMSLVPD